MKKGWGGDRQTGEVRWDTVGWFGYVTSLRVAAPHPNLHLVHST